QRRGSRVAARPEVLAQALIELEAVAGAGDERSLDDGGAAVVWVLRPQTDAVADLEALRVGERDLLVVPVRIGREFRRDGRLLHEYGLRSAADEPDVGAQIDRVA